MSRTTTAASGSEARLVRILDRYLAALQEGAVLDKSALLVEHPDLAEDLEACLASLEFIRHAAVKPVAPEADEEQGRIGPIADPELGTLGDFRILREVGRGGMGVVYEAEQISLGRRVAIKVLPFAAALDQRQLQRFKVEAQAAAQLHHTHIVPVFTVGAERGVHFYAMQFIEGRTLAEVIRELRQLDDVAPAKAQAASDDPADPLTPGSSTRTRAFFRGVAELGIQAAEALDYAHSVGVIHRDIKPANVLIDARGSLWITDFGLAQFHAEPGLTITGDLVGTLRYMSPEQALGHPALIDQRTDVYSLGMTLYELVALRPAFPGDDRQALLRQIADEEPLSPRRLNPAIPRELETIVLKAMAKEPEGRFTTARDLSEDLRRFLEHKPIRARRPSLADRVVKWSRRHTAVVASVLALLVISVIGFGLATLLIWKEQARTQRAYQAEAQLRRKARKAVDEMYGQVTQQLLIEKPDVEKVRRGFLEKALAYYRDFAVEPEADPEARHEAAQALCRVGDIQRGLGGSPGAEGAYRQAIALLDDLARHYPGEPTYRDDLARCHELLGFALSNGRMQGAERSHRQGLALAERLVADFPHEPRYQRRVASLCINLGTLLYQSGRFHELDVLWCRARDLLARVVENFPQDTGAKRELATSSNNLGALHMDMGRREEAENEVRAAIRLYQERSAEHSDNLEERHGLAFSYANLSELLLDLGRLQEAEESNRKAIALVEKLVKEFPNLSYLPQSMSGLDELLGRIVKADGRLGEAEQAFRQSLAIAEKLAADMPSRVIGESARPSAGLGKVLWETGRLRESRELFHRARDVWKREISVSPNSPENRRELALLLADWPDRELREPDRAVAVAREAVEQSPHMVAAWDALGIALYRAGAAKEAVQPLKRSVEMTSGGSVKIQFFLALALRQAGDKDQAKLWYDKATDWTAKKRPKDQELLRLRAEAAALLGLSDAPKPVPKEMNHSK